MKFLKEDKELILNEALNYSDCFQRILENIDYDEDGFFNCMWFNLKDLGVVKDIVKKFYFNNGLFLIVVEFEEGCAIYDNKCNKEIFISLDSGEKGFEEFFVINKEYECLKENIIKEIKYNIINREKDFISKKISFNNVENKKKKRI